MNLEAIHAARPPAGPHRPRAALAVVAGYTLLWAGIEVLAFSAGVGVEQLVWTRYGIHLLVMVSILGPLRGTALVRTTRPGLHVIRSLTMLAMPVSYLLASAHLSPRNVLAVFWIAPLLLLAMAARRQPRWRLACALAAFTGTVLLLRPGMGAVSGYAILSIAMAVSFASYIRLTEISTDSPSVNLFHSALWVFLALTPRVPFVWQWPEATGWLVMAAVAVLGLLSLYLIDIAVRWGGSAIFVPVLYLQPAFLLLIASGGGGVGRRELAGVLLVAAAVTVAALQEARVARRTDVAR